MLSILIQYIAAFKAMMKAVELRVNGSKDPLQYTFTTELKKEFSADMTWNTGSIDNTVVTVDFVAMDSDLPLAKWDKLGVATGEVPKFGKKIVLSERLLSDIDNMIAKSADTATVAEKLFSGAVKLVSGVAETMQYRYDQALSSGLMLVDDDTNVGVGFRVNFRYLNANKFGVVLPWSDANAKPLDDIKRVLKTAKAKGDTISILKMDDTTFDNFSRNTQVREQFAFYNNYVGSVQNVPSLDLEKVNLMLKNNSQFKVQIQIMDRTVTHERNGVRTTVPTWTPNKVVFLTSTKVGRLVWSKLAEATRPSKKVEYTFVDQYIMTKLWRDEEPFAENISVQGLALPIIDNVGSIYVLDAEEAVIDAQTEGDANFAYKGTNYTKSSVVASYKLIKPNSTITFSTTDANIMAGVNKLSEEDVLKFEGNITPA
ncbi:major capsid protein [Flavobacterium piscisymbiosum]|uniref:Major capsid protein n=1 Tax=Flavobacterium piscisymbiosum TaxID=2893753 RepID=A0ABS8MLN9_9FLAO|nr:major capsid protein [Flavobacterium sp. F-30]MCC9066288.1 major capsid protein [Flavobacterium sp. F-30]